MNLTKETVDDSATVRVVTFVTLIYLPASFVSVSTFCMKESPYWPTSFTVHLRNEPIHLWDYGRIWFPDLSSILDLCSNFCAPDSSHYRCLVHNRPTKKQEASAWQFTQVAKEEWGIKKERKPPKAAFLGDLTWCFAPRLATSRPRRPLRYAIDYEHDFTA